MLACSRRIWLIAHQHARVVNNARGAATSGSCSVNTLVGHDDSSHRQVRLRHTSWPLSATARRSRRVCSLSGQTLRRASVSHEHPQEPRQGPFGTVVNHPPQQHRRPLRSVRRPECGLESEEGALPGQLPGPVALDGHPIGSPRRHRSPRAARYFADKALVTAELHGRTLPGAGADISFLHADYTEPLPIPPASFDLLISLYGTRLGALSPVPLTPRAAPGQHQPR